jgi:hypothetical protein
MRRYFAAIVALAVVHSTSAVDRIRLWLSPEPPTPGWFASAAVTDQSMQSRDTVLRQGTPEDVPAPSQPAAALDGLPAAAGEAYYIWARFDALSLEDTRVRGMNLQVLVTGDLSVNYIWYNWDSRAILRWAPGSDLAGSEVTMAASLDGVGSGWINGPTFDPRDRLDAYSITPTIEDPIKGDVYGQGAILLGKIGWVDGAGELMLRLGSNGIATTTGTQVALGTGTTFIDGGVGAPGRGYGIQGRFIPEPATLVLLALGAPFLRRGR